MGLYRIPVRPEKIKAVPQIMKSIGFPVIRTERQERTTCYFCVNPKRSNKHWTFCIRQEEEGGPHFFSCGLSQLSKQIVNALALEDFFDREIASHADDGLRRARISRGRSATI